MKNDDIKGLDVKGGMAVVANNKTVYVRLLKSFASNAFGEQLIEAIASGDTEQIRQKAHALKGVAGNMRMNELQELCRLVEADAKEGGAVSPDNLENLKAAYARTSGSVNMLLSDPDILGNLE